MTSEQWAPAQEAHSIEIVGAAIVLAQPMGDVLHKRILRLAEPLANAAGLVNPAPSGTAVQVVVGPGGNPQLTQTPAGITFQRLELLVQPNGSYQSQAVEELVVERPSIIYRTRAYTRWPQFKEKLTTLLSPLLEVILGVEAVTAVRLEYRDRFMFDGNPSNAAVGSVLRHGSPYIAPHVFDRDDLWHSYTGMFVPGVAGGEKRLIQVTIDATNVTMANQNERRTIAIMTALQDNLAPDNDPPPEGSDVSQNFLDRFEDLHKVSINFFGQIVSDEMGKRIGLT